MTHPVRRIAQLLPKPLKSKMRDTFLQTVYYNLSLSSVEDEKVMIQSGVGEFELLIPEGRKLPGGISYEEGVHEPALVSKLDDILSSESVFYDVGARYGYFVGVAKEVGVKPSNIHAFEQHPLSFNLLSNCWRDSGVHLSQCTVGNAESEMRIDDYTTNHQPPDIIKIDVEGAELSVLRGSSDTLAQHSPHLFVEVHPRRLETKEESSTELISLLAEHGYTMQCARHREDVPEVNWDDISEFQEANTTYLLYARP